MSREGMSAKVRWHVLSRDRFTCQYCGASGPGVVLHVDHIISVAEGGGDDEENLNAACELCNLGKGSRSLYTYRAVVYYWSRSEWSGAKHALIDLIVNKFRGAERDWATRLVDRVDFQVALVLVAERDDWRDLVEALSAEFFTSMLRGKLPAELQENYAEHQRRDLERIWDRWAPLYLRKPPDPEEPSEPDPVTSSEVN